MNAIEKMKKEGMLKDFILNIGCCQPEPLYKCPSSFELYEQIGCENNC